MAQAEEVTSVEAPVGESNITPAWEDTTGRVLVQLEFYRETRIRAREELRAWERFQRRMNRIDDEVGYWKTIVLDSVTFAELAARKLNQYKINPRSREPRQWFAGSTDALEEMIMMTFSAIPVNVVVIAHISEKTTTVHGTEVFAPNAPGRLRGNLASAFPEYYHAEVVEDEKKNRIFQLQTRRDGQFNCASQIGAPDPCTPEFKAVWAGWEAEGRERYPLHTFVYSESGGGKSTFAATFPKPMLVLMFDPIGKDAPYRRRGVAREVGTDELGTDIVRVYARENADGPRRKVQR